MADLASADGYIQVDNRFVFMTEDTPPSRRLATPVRDLATLDDLPDDDIEQVPCLRIASWLFCCCADPSFRACALARTPGLT